MNQLASNPEISELLESFLPQLTQQIHQDEQERLNQQIIEQLEAKKKQLKSQYNLKLQKELETSHESFNDWYKVENQKFEELKAKEQQKKVEEYSISQQEEEEYIKRVLIELMDSQMLKQIKNTLTSIIEKNVAAKYQAIFEQESKKIKRSIQQSYQSNKTEEIRKYEEGLLNKAADKTQLLLKQKQRVQQERIAIKARVEREREEHKEAKERYEKMTEVYSNKIEDVKKEIKQLRQRY